MSIRDIIEAALEAKRRAALRMHMAFEAGEPFLRLRIDYDASWKALERLLTDDTIAALVAVARAAEREPDCPLCGAETHTAGRRAVPEPHLPDCPLAPLVKEADDE